MDEEEQHQTQGEYGKVALHEDDASALLKEEASNEETDGLMAPAPSGDSPGIWTKTLLPDNGISIRGHALVEGSFAIKLIKFVLLTFGSISLLHWIVSHRANHRDTNLKLSHIWVFDGDLIVRDSIVFFVVGRMWRQRGVDQLAFVGMMILSNLYLESQHYVHFLGHAFTLYEVHCTWPLQLWVFVLVAIPLVGSVLRMHVVRAYTNRLLLMKLVELTFCFFFFLVPLASSSYFHMHHWYIGWLLGMHCNFDVWWSRAAMAWCWGMYINGIAVYGRDPVLTCEYAYFLSMGQHCPYTRCYMDALKDMAAHPHNATHTVKEMVPVNWRNCSSSDAYHP